MVSKPRVKCHMEPAGKYVRVNSSGPEAFGICDLCGLRFNHIDLRWNFEWAGQQLWNTRSLRCWRCVDVPNETLRAIVLPADPLPIINARTENFAYEDQTIRIFQRGGAPYQLGTERPPIPPPLQPYTAIASQPPWNAGPQYIRVVQGTQIPRIIQLNTSS